MPPDDTPARALAVYAHPDDAEVAAGGTLARWADAGCSVWLLVVAQGDKGTADPDADLAALAEQRVDETARAAELLGFAGHEHLGYPDGEVPDTRELRGAIVRVVRAQRPDVVLCPDPTSVLFGDGYFNHHDHRVTGWATLDAVAPAAANPHYFPEQIGSDDLSVHQVAAVYLTGTLEPNTWVDIGDTLERKIDALFCHSSQLTDAGDWFRQFLRDRAADAGTGTPGRHAPGAAAVRYAEAFRRLNFAV
jgi:LmbE family N-acetylglucosaminyl deacetylase